MVGDILQPTHLLFVLVVALLVLGPKRLPEVGRTLGNGLRDFRAAINGEPERREEPGGQSLGDQTSPEPVHMASMQPASPVAAPAEVLSATPSAPHPAAHSETVPALALSGDAVATATAPGEVLVTNAAAAEVIHPAADAGHAFAHSGATSAGEGAGGQGAGQDAGSASDERVEPLA